MKILIIVFASVLFSNLLVGQKIDKKNHTVGYHQIFYSGIEVDNHGFGGSFRRGFHKTVKIKKLFEVDLVTLKHPREVKQSTNELAGNFVFGKLNYAYNLRLGYGQHKILAYKPFGDGVELKAIYAFGLTTIFLKPAYYLVVYQGQPQPVEERFDSDKHELYNIVGSGSYFKGFNELTLQPGAYARLGLNFEYSSERQSIRSVEAGVIVDLYPKDVKILAFDRNYPVYVSFYLALQYGRKWYR